MSINWKPGDVAMVRLDDRDGEFIGLRDTHGWATNRTDRQRSHAHWTNAAYVTPVRPLVVIDPEDREQVERLHDLIDAAENDSMDDYALDEDSARLWAVGAVETALREFANPTPPKPEEPTGLGAVVEDADGDRWVLYTSPDSTAPWCNGSTSCEWDEVDAVRVLSGGVRDV